jgi:uncharacterized protein (TIGR00251 family)
MADLSPCSWNNDSLTLNVRVQPRASKDEVVGIQGKYLKIRITAPPAAGKANDHLIRFLAREFATPRSRIQLVSGESVREKRLLIVAPGRLPSYLPAECDRPHTQSGHPAARNSGKNPIKN